jgi:hypothetical protein
MLSLGVVINKLIERHTARGSQTKAEHVATAHADDVLDCLINNRTEMYSGRSATLAENGDDLSLHLPFAVPDALRNQDRFQL